MGACFHIAGVTCDNCRPFTGTIIGGPIINTGRSIGDLVGTYPPPLATAAEVAALRAEVATLREMVSALVGLGSRSAQPPMESGPAKKTKKAGEIVCFRVKKTTDERNGNTVFAALTYGPNDEWLGVMGSWGTRELAVENTKRMAAVCGAKYEEVP